jgi:hypothetical protein
MPGEDGGEKIPVFRDHLGKGAELLRGAGKPVKEEDRPRRTMDPCRDPEIL